MMTKASPTTLGGLSEYITSGSRDWSKFYSDSGALFIRTQDINKNRLDTSSSARVALPEKVEGKRTRLRKGDLLITITGANVGKCAVVDWDIEEAYVSQSVALVRLKDPSAAKFIFYQLIRKDGHQSYLEKTAYGLGRPVLNLTNIRDVPIISADDSARVAVVAEIEKQLSRLDEAVTALKRIQANLKRYKAAVLKAAVEGKLTEKWRKEHPDVEHADQLLKRILAERRTKWEAEELAKMKAKGIKPKDDSWKKKYKEPVGPDTANLPELPEGWVWASPIQIDSGEAYATAIGPFGSNLKVSDYRTEGVPLVFVRNIRSKIYSGAETRYVSGNKSKELRPHWVRPGDVLVTKMGDPPGDATSYPEGFPIAVITADCIKITLSAVIKKHQSIVVHAINSEVIKRQIAEITRGVAQQKISLARFAQVGIPLPPLNEQTAILGELDRRLSVTEELEAAIATNVTRAERLRQTILVKCFLEI